ncbi:MAG: SHOCT domain-containing protein [Dehalococcoidales bacterium]|nr:SHOCT domain-containing protein [Dehalococcoidales bacterium]
MDKNVKTALIIGSIVLAAFIIVPSVVGAISGWQGGDWGWGMMGPGMMGGFGLMWLWPIAWLVILVLIIWAVVAAISSTSQAGGSGSASSQSDSALEILKKRYARGEINKEEYEEKKKDLE